MSCEIKWGYISYICVGCGPFPVTVANKGLVRDSLLKMVHNPGGHWNPGKGPYPIYVLIHGIFDGFLNV